MKICFHLLIIVSLCFWGGLSPSLAQPSKKAQSSKYEICLPQSPIEKIMDNLSAISLFQPEDTLSSTDASLQPSSYKPCVDDIQKLTEAEPTGELKVTLEELLSLHGDLPNSAQEALREAFQFYQANFSLIKNRKYITVVDYTQSAKAERFYSFDMETGKVIKSKVSHGKNSGDSAGNFRCYSNKNESLSTPEGFHLTGEEYNGKYGNSVRLHGLEPENSTSCDRAVVIHRAKYITGDATGRSFGCPAIPFNETSEDLLDSQLSGGSLFFNYIGNFPECKPPAKVVTKSKKKKKKRKK